MKNTYQSLATTAGGHDKLTFIEKNLQNHIEKCVRIIQEERDAQSLMQYFHRMQQKTTTSFMKLN
ncbi:hypothetical protein AHAS_Ahas05G0104700 [Arachis hypogaea]